MIQSKNRLFYTLKFHSARLKEFGYDINITIKEAKKTKEIISLADSQILRSIRDIREIEFDYNLLESLIFKKEQLKHRSNSPEISRQIREIQDEIDKMTYIEDYITIVMDHPVHYKDMFNKGIQINGKTYRRLSCSAGQARVSTVVFCNIEIIEELKRRLNNGRIEKPLAPSKYNAYFGLSGSATKQVSEPKFIVIKDYENTTTFMANYVTETAWDVDDETDVREIKDMTMNRTDGMGLISYEQSKKWADELGLEYIPSQWCVRQNFIKGMLCTFPIHEFCESENNGNYLVDTIYKDKNGDTIKADLRECDVILTESMFKLWDSFPDIDTYIKGCHENKLYWGISQYTPKKAKDILTLNYQFLQTLDLDEDNVEVLCSQFVEWLEGVSYDNYGYMLLFLLGTDINERKAENVFRYGENQILRALMANSEVKNDKYIRTKIREMIKTKIHNACMGEIIVDGNFQVIVSDPYAFMQHVCGIPVTGLLKEGESYSNYWNERDVSVVDTMRSPLTYRSEHVVATLVKNEMTEKWYRHCKLGFILNWYGHECVRYAGSDFDFDLVSSTSNKIMINSVYKDELPVTYDPPKPQKILFTEEDLYNSDLFSFGSIIGSITNKGSNGYALLPLIENEYGCDSDEYKILLSRLQQCCKAQSAQIDKAKIGKNVKGIPKAWIEKNKNEKLNKILLNKYPYFFIYRYKDAKDRYKKHVDENNMACYAFFKMSVDDLLKIENPDEKQKLFISNYYKYMPVTISDSSMNLVCRRIEKIDFNVNKKIKTQGEFDWSIYKNESVDYTEKEYKAVIKLINEQLQGYKGGKEAKLNNSLQKFNPDDMGTFLSGIESIEDDVLNVCSNIDAVTNILVDYYYKNKPSANKELLWRLVGKRIIQNILEKTNHSIRFPVAAEDGDIKYLGNIYKIEDITID